MQSTVKQRLIDFLTIKKISKSEFGRRIGVSSAFITSMRTSIQPDKIKSIALNFPELNTLWLLTGEGEMLKKETSEVEMPKQNADNVIIPREVLDLLLSQQRTMEMQQKTVEAQQGNFTKLTETVTAQAEAISDLAKKGERVGGAKVAAG